MVSANADTKDVIDRGSNGMRNHTCFCAHTISLKFKEPTHKITLIRIKPIDTSYDTIWAADLEAPKKAYLELLAHPEIRIPYTPNGGTAKIYSIPIFTSANTIVSSEGITARPAELSVDVIIGAAINIVGFALLGNTVSFKSSFGPSAKGCNKPKNPTTFGPLRLCMDAITFRSEGVR